MNNEKSDYINDEELDYIHIRQPVRTSIWNIFTSSVILINSTIKKELSDTLSDWVDKKYGKCCKCGADIDDENYSLIVENKNKIFYCKECDNKIEVIKSDNFKIDEKNKIYNKHTGIIYCELDNDYINELEDLLKDVSRNFVIFKKERNDNDFIKDLSEFIYEVFGRLNKKIDGELNFSIKEISNRRDMLENNKLVIESLKKELAQIKNNHNIPLSNEIEKLKNEINIIKNERKEVLKELIIKKEDEEKNLTSIKKQLCYVGNPKYKIKEYIPVVEKPVGREYLYIWHHIDPVLPYVVPCKKTIHDAFCGDFNKENHINNVNSFLGIIGIDYTFMPGLFKQFEIE